MHDFTVTFICRTQYSAYQMSHCRFATAITPYLAMSHCHWIYN